MTKKDKKPKGQRDPKVGHRTGTIIKLIKLDYIAEILCWCGQVITIDSSKSVEENVCPSCGSPYKLMDQEWTDSEMKKFIELKELK